MRRFTLHSQAHSSLAALKKWLASSLVLTFALHGVCNYTHVASIPGLFVATAHAQEEEAEPKEAKKGRSGATEINVKNADISSVLKIFSKKTKRNYILDERVKGKVSIYLPGKISSDEAIRILDAVLQLKGFTAVPIGDNLWKILPSREARQTTIPTITEEIDGRGSPTMVTKLINLKFVGADDIKQLVSPLVSSNGLLNAYTGTNSLIIIDAEENIKRLEKLISSLDVAYRNQDLAIIPVKNAEAVDIAEKITSILSDDDDGGASGSATPANVRTRARNTGGGNNAGTETRTSADSLTVGGRSRAPKIISDERTNSIIVVADEDSVLRIKALVDQLDSPIDLSGSRFYVYRCQHANAEEIAEVLSGLVSGGGTGGGTGNTNSSLGNNRNNQNDRNNGRTSSSRARARSSSRLERQRRQPGQSRNTGSTSSGVTSVSFGEDVSVTADPATNSLIINAGKTDYIKIKELLKQLDIKRRQVLVEALVLEVNVTNQKDTSFEFLSSGGGDDGGVFTSNNLGNLGTLLANPAQLSNFSIAAASAGSLTLPGGIVIPTQTALIRAAQTNGNVNILSSPNILATDNEEAEIVVGQNVPFIASTASNDVNLNNTFNQIDRQDVGITLRLTPQISSSDFVTLRLFTEVSDVVAGTAGSTLGPTTTVRTSETTVITKNDQMIVIGGLMGDNQQVSEEGVPFLMDIPIIGHAFKSRTERDAKTNLLIFITPRIVSDQFDARDASLDLTDSMEGHIERNGVLPDRSDVLRDEKIDDVILSHVDDYEGPIPTTIKGPSTPKSIEVARGSLSRNAGIEGYDRAPAPRGNLTATPKIPMTPKSQTAPKAFKVAPAIPSAAGAKTAKTSAKLPRRQATAMGSTKRFVVLKADSNSSVKTPFPLTSDNRLVLVEVPSGARPEAAGFFVPGQRYSYRSGSGALALRALGTFASRSEAQQFYKVNEGTWFTLSPFEVMNMGKGPWVAGN